MVTLAAGPRFRAYGAWMALAGSLWPFLSLPLALLVCKVLSANDAMLSREYGQPSQRGATLNELGDVIPDAVMYAVPP
jgi:hypothetical protein